MIRIHASTVLAGNATKTAQVSIVALVVEVQLRRNGTDKIFVREFVSHRLAFSGPEESVAAVSLVSSPGPTDVVSLVGLLDVLEEPVDSRLDFVLPPAHYAATSTRFLLVRALLHAR
nr:hypothetical protein [Micromonospora sp. DSM 115978]